MYMQVILVTRAGLSSTAGKVKLFVCLCWLLLAKSQSKSLYNCLSVDKSCLQTPLWTHEQILAFLFTFVVFVELLV